MNTRKNSPRLILLAATLVASMGCYAQAASSPGVTDSKIRIAVAGPYTGNAAVYAQTQLGAIAYLKKINEEGGIHGRQIEIVKADTGCNEVTAISIFKKIITDDIFATIGLSCSGPTLAAKPTIIDGQMPTLVTQAVTDSIAQPANPYIFRGVPNTIDAARAMVDFIMSRPGENKIGIISHDDEWGRSYRDPEVAYLKEKYGIDPVADVVMARGATNVTPQVLKLRQAGANYIITNIYPVDTVVFLKEAHTLGLKGPYISGWVTDLKTTMARAKDFELVRNYCVLSQLKAPIAHDVMKPWTDVIEKYEPTATITAFNYLGVGSAVIMVEALKNAGPDLTREKYLAALNNLKDFDTGVFAGKVTFAPDKHEGNGVAVAECYDSKQVPQFLTKWDTPVAG
jgi:branched-chain amino acid transport system substrate-binding protein